MWKNFTLDELIYSETANKYKIDNTPTEEVIANLNMLVVEVLDPARELLGRAISCSSGYRSPLLNNKVKGAKTSQHLLGEAADLTCYNNIYLFNLIKENLIYDQLIYETKDILDKDGKKLRTISWVHVSYRKGKNRNEAFKLHNNKRV